MNNKFADVAKKELIGLKIKVTDSKNKNNINITGNVIDETKKTLVIDDNGTRKRLMKNDIIIMVEKDNKKIIINGKLLKGGPEERIKSR